VSPSRQLLQTAARGLNVNRLGQHPPPARNDRIGTDDERVMGTVGNGRGFRTGKAPGKGARQFATQRLFVDVCGNNGVRLDADLAKESKSTR
jgi:hypothetical protein